MNPAQVAAHSNSYFHEWGMIALGTLFVSLITFYFLIIREDKNKLEIAKLTITTTLANIFQTFIIDETTKILQLLTDHIPDALSQTSIIDTKLTNFDYLCTALVEQNALPNGVPNREIIDIILKDSSSNIITFRANRLLELMRPNTKQIYNPTGISYNLELNAATKLEYLAQKLQIVNRKVNVYNYSKEVLLISTCLVGIISLLIISLLVFDFEIINLIMLISILSYASIGIVAIISLIYLVNSKSWLENKSQKDSLETWVREFGKESGSQ